MNTLNYSTARKELASTMKQVCRDHTPVLITKNGDCAVVMLSLSDYQSMNETDYLLQNPANAAHLQKSIEQVKNQEARTMTLEEFEALTHA